LYFLGFTFANSNQNHIFSPIFLFTFQARNKPADGSGHLTQKQRDKTPAGQKGAPAKATAHSGQWQKKKQLKKMIFHLKDDLQILQFAIWNFKNYY
jgi:hypothetical protein